MLRVALNIRRQTQHLCQPRGLLAGGVGNTVFEVYLSDCPVSDDAITDSVLVVVLNTLTKLTDNPTLSPRST